MAVAPLNLWIETSGSWEQPYAALALVGLLLAEVGNLGDVVDRAAQAAAAGRPVGIRSEDVRPVVVS